MVRNKGEKLRGVHTDRMKKWVNFIIKTFKFKDRIAIMGQIKLKEKKVQWDKEGVR